MQNKILLVIAVVLSVINYNMECSVKTTFFYSSPQKINVKDSISNKISTMDLENYVIGVVAAEMPASFPIEALKAQAIASRTYAMYKIENSTKNFDVVTDVSNQKYITIIEMKDKWKNDFDKYYEKIKDAVEGTKGQILKYNGEIIESFYFSMSNGFTEDSSYVFGEEKDYLKSVESKYESSLKNFSYEKEFTKDEFCKLLSISCNEIVISNIIRSNSNRVNSISINNETFKGTDIRKKLNLRSTDFIINVNGSNVIITTFGYGHGVGMSQYGAMGLANDGYSYEEILKYYYKNVEIDNI